MIVPAAFQEPEPINSVPESLRKYNLIIGNNKKSFDYTYNIQEKQTGITNLLQDIKDSGLKLKDLKEFLVNHRKSVMFVVVLVK